jgi:hypothetical protein
MASCSLSEELDKISDINSIEATGSFNANVLNDTLNLSELITQDNLDLKEDPKTGDYSFGFENSSDYKIESVIFPQKRFNLLPVTLPPEYTNPLISVLTGDIDLPEVVSSFSLETPKIGDTDFPVGFKINEIKLKTGAKISLVLKNEFNLKARITVTITNLTKNGSPYSKVFDNIRADDTLNLEINDLDGYSLYTSGEMEIKIATTIIKTSSGPIIGDKMTFSTTIDIADHHESVKGFFGKIVLNPDPIAVDVKLPDGFVKNSNSDMIIKEAVITLTVDKKDLTLPIDLELSGEGITVVKTTTEEDLTSDTNIFEFKIIDLHILNLTQLKLTPVVTLNKKVFTPLQKNELMDISSLTIKAKVDIPMDIQAKDLTFEQEGDNSFYEASVKESDFEFINGEVRLSGSINSGIPLSASVQVYYKDDTNILPILTLFDNPIEIKLGDNNFEVSVTAKKLDDIKKYPIQVIKVTLNGSGSINSEQEITFKIGLAAKGTITTKI